MFSLSDAFDVEKQLRLGFSLPLPMIYSLTLETALLVVGIALVTGHLAALSFGSFVQRHLRAFPRSVPSGVLLFVAAAGWFAGLVAFTDLGEFSSMRSKFLLFTVVGAGLMLRFVQEFLSVRALGMLLLLAAEPLLEACWMRQETGRLWLVGLVYGWIVAGLFFIGTPYVLRDAIHWASAAGWRWKAVCISGIAYGVLLLATRSAMGV
ncbi:MAG: hypothetical protein DVB28_000693 [Verrucomicrobia bacterium]|nr:MAG: hypothetical protein DVB28_000693 [Verrucomicrobiota bacterium]